MTVDTYEVDRKVDKSFQNQSTFVEVTFLWHHFPFVNFTLSCDLSRGSASLSMWARQVSRLEMPAGSCSASSMVSVLMESHWKPLQNPTLMKTNSTHSLILVAQVVMFPGRCMLTWSPQWLVRALVLCLYKVRFATWSPFFTYVVPLCLVQWIVGVYTITCKKNSDTLRSLCDYICYFDKLELKCIFYYTTYNICNLYISYSII